ncbi:MAG: D-alanine--D-alanine ligase family protein [Patescibacteria group bacterium]
MKDDSISIKLKIAVVYGGRSKERPGSLISGKAVYKSLIKQGFRNSYLVDPLEKDFIRKLNESDIVFLMLHGRYGEDGKIQGYLETIGKPYVGSGVLASALGMDKYYFKTFLSLVGIPTPRFEVLPDVSTDRVFVRIMRKLGVPLFLKPISEGGSLGSNVIHTKAKFIDNFNTFKKQGYDKFLAEEYIKGRSLTVGVLQQKGRISVLPILETISKKEFYDYEAKHNPKLHEYRCPAPLGPTITKKVKELAKRVFYLTGCYGFCRVDFMLDSKTNTAYVLEINTLPGMSLHSNMATSANAAGIDYDQLVMEMLKTAFIRPEYLP